MDTAVGSGMQGVIIAVISNWLEADLPNKHHGDKRVKSFGAWNDNPTKNLLLVKYCTKKKGGGLPFKIENNQRLDKYY